MLHHFGIIARKQAKDAKLTHAEFFILHIGVHKLYDLKSAVCVGLHKSILLGHVAYEGFVTCHMRIHKRFISAF